MKLVNQIYIFIKLLIFIFASIRYNPYFLKIFNFLIYLNQYLFIFSNKIYCQIFESIYPLIKMLIIIKFIPYLLNLIHLIHL